MLKRCGICLGLNHKAAFCNQVGRTGWMEACCKCDSLEHTYDCCPQRQQEEDFQYLILNRSNKGPVKCSLSLGRVVLSELRRPNTSYKEDQIVALPYSANFAKQIKQSFDTNGKATFTINCKLVKANSHLIEDNGQLSENSRRNKTLGQAVGILRAHFWTEDHDSNDINEICENCGCHGHSVHNCISACGFCGSDDHYTVYCKIRNEACLCRKYPKHCHYQCNLTCRYCYQEDNDESGLQTAKHEVRNCPRGCHYCLDKGHTIDQCDSISKAADRQCSQCPPGTYHYPIAHKLCPELSFDKVLENEGMAKHSCQWKRSYNSPLGLSLVCQKNVDHCRASAEYLHNRRLKAFSGLVIAAATGIKSVAYPVECLECQDGTARLP
ncbi:hypothetical protein F5Y10DRAFT_281839 [Nemania abortiva]|nr:hypothetical protein F5Y10DRAFT_281839 [Nemania abortiva]